MSARTAALPALAMVIVAGVLGVQLANGGGDFEPRRAANPCDPRAVQAVAEGIEGLAEQLVLLGLDAAACRIGTTRESLVLDFAVAETPDDDHVDALRGGLLDAVERLEQEERLPKASELADEAIEEADLNRFVKAALRAIPDALIDNRLKTGNVLRHAIQDLDVRRMLENLDDPAELNALVRDTVTDAVKDEIIDGLPDPI